MVYEKVIVVLRYGVLTGASFACLLLDKGQSTVAQDRYGFSWQIVPTIMNDMMQNKDAKKLAQVTKAFLKMKKFDIAELIKAYEYMPLSKEVIGAFLATSEHI